jgi:hypothetical protein
MLGGTGAIVAHRLRDFSRTKARAHARLSREILNAGSMGMHAD